MKIYPTPENRVPEGATCHDVITSDGVHLRALAVRHSKAKGTVIILNGRAEYVERYFETMHDLLQRGFAVIGFDWRGQGGSQRLLSNPLRGYVKSFADYDRDLAAIVGLAGRLDYPEPFYALAHSTGGNILLRALREKKWFKRAVIISPLLGLHLGPWPLSVARFLTFLAKILGLSWIYLPGYARGPMRRNEFQDNPLTSDRGRWNRDMNTLEAHPELGLGGPTFGWLRAALNSVAALHHWPKNKGPTCPVMIILAGKDRVVQNLAIHDFVGRVPGLALSTIAEAQHEILMENDAIRARFFAAFDAFIAL
jgi:lysophospholipase